MTIHLTKADFLKKVVDFEKNPNNWNYLGDKPAIIDFYATWCGPCNSIAPILEELADEYKNQIYIYKIDTDQEEELANYFNILSIPTLFFVPLKGEPKILKGALSKTILKNEIERSLLS